MELTKRLRKRKFWTVSKIIKYKIPQSNNSDDDKLVFWEK